MNESERLDVVVAALFNGMPAGRVSGATWRKSKRSGPEGNCVEVAELPTGEVAVRNSRDPEGPALVYSRDEIAAFVAGIKDGEFDVTAAEELAVAPAAVTASAPASAKHEAPSSTAPHTTSHLPWHATGPQAKTAAQEHVEHELLRLTDTLLTGEAVLDRADSERLLRVLGAAVSLYGLHRVDQHDRCTACSTKRRRRWLPWSRNHICSVHATFNQHFGMQTAQFTGRGQQELRPSG